MAKASRAHVSSTDEAGSADAPAPTELHLHSPGVHVEGSLKSVFRVEDGWALSEDAIGVMVSKPGSRFRAPWNHVRCVNYVPEGE